MTLWKLDEIVSWKLKKTFTFIATEAAKVHLSNLLGISMPGQQKMSKRLFRKPVFRKALNRITQLTT